MSERYKTHEGGIYFVTLTVVGWIDVFTRHEYAEEILRNLTYCAQHKGLRVYEFSLMPSHLHLISSADSGRLGELLRDFKSYTAKRLVHLIETHPQESRREWLLYLLRRFGRMAGQETQFWQPGFHPIDLTDDAARAQQRRHYVLQNPVQARLVDEPQHYPFCSAFPDCGVPLSEW